MLYILIYTKGMIFYIHIHKYSYETNFKKDRGSGYQI